ncbi:MAG: hypothetical protein ABI180_13870 [Microcoleus sp.]
MNCQVLAYQLLVITEGRRKKEEGRREDGRRKKQSNLGFQK